MNMKCPKIKVGLFLLGLILLSILLHQKPIELTDQSQNIGESMVKYYNLDGDEYVGEFFRVKIIGISKVSDPVNTGYTKYVFQFVLAPRYEVPFEIKKISLWPSNQDIYKYIRNTEKVQDYDNYFPRDYLKSTLHNGKDMIFESFYVSMSIDDIGKKNWSKWGLTEAVFDREIRDICVTIYYDFAKKDVFHLSFNKEWEITPVHEKCFTVLE